MNLSKHIKVEKLVSGTTEVDVTNYDGVLFFGEGTKLEVSQGTAGKIAEATAESGLVYVDVVRPLETQGAKLKATLTGTGDLFAVLYQGRVKPEEWGTGVVAISPEAQ